MDIVSISKRFISLVANLESKGLIKSKSQLAERLGTHKQSFNEILNGKRNVTLELASRICEHFYANPAYILLGHSPLFINKESETKKNISHVPTKAQAGYGGQIDCPIFESDLEKFSIPGSHFHEDDYRSFEVEGESMEPNFFKGDNVVCSAIAPVYFAQALRENAAYIVVTEDSILLKRIVNKIASESKITIVSDNPAFENKDIDVNDIKEIWKVEGLITTRINK
jgi:transcriptional regulator with XRE-family HTH domain